MTKNLLEILEENNIRLTPRGERWVANCPFHEGDRDPSFTVYPDLTYYCFGCKVWGDAIKFLVDYKGMPEELALQYAGVEARAKRPRKRVIKLLHQMNTWKYLDGIADQYHQFLLKTPGALNYLYNRGLTDETIRKYRIGYTDGAVVDPQTVDEYRSAREANIITETDDNDWWETLSHRITIPNSPQHGLTDFIMGRTVTKSKSKYLGLRIPKPIYGLSEIGSNNVLFLVEGHFDYLTLKQWGYPAILVGGTSIPEYNMIPLRSRFIVIVCDNDEEGIKSANKLHENLPDSEILDYSEWGTKDVSELATQENGQEKFHISVSRLDIWRQGLFQLTMTLDQWFPRSTKQEPSLST
jgi:DNA primase